MRFFIMSVATVLGAVAIATTAQGQKPTPAARSQHAEPKKVVAEVRKIIAERYVLPERRPALDAVLAKGLTSGRYNVTDPAVLAERINSDLETAGNDRHLGFSFDPQQAAIIGAARSETAPNPAAYEREVRAANHGVTELKLLPGNIRYMAYDGFMWVGPESAAALDNAVRFLAGGDAVIIDIRRNGGGSPEAVQYLVSHFMPADRPLMSFYMNGKTTADRTATLAQLPAGRMIGKPLYVLTGSGSASAAEEFAGHVAGYRLGELVGETTAGAGFRNELVVIPGGFVLSVSVGRGVLASTGKDWEGIGITPTMRTAVPRALDAAQVQALRRLAAAARAEDRSRLEAIASGIAARMEPRAPTLPLTAYAGRYGERSIIAEDGRLYYQRASRPRTALIPLGGNRFALDTDPAVQLDFAASGNQVTALEIVPAGQPSQGRFDRTS